MSTYTIQKLYMPQMIFHDKKIDFSLFNGHW